MEKAPLPGGFNFYLLGFGGLFPLPPPEGFPVVEGPFGGLLLPFPIIVLLKIKDILISAGQILFLIFIMFIFKTLKTSGNKQKKHFNQKYAPF